MMVKTVVDRVVDSDLGLSFKLSNILPTPIKFSPVNPPGKVDCIIN